MRAMRLSSPALLFGLLLLGVPGASVQPTISGRAFPIPTSDSSPHGITAGPDGNLWFTEYYGNQIGRITTSGTITEFPLPTGIAPYEITTGEDGNVWFTETNDQIGRITPSGTITEFAIPTQGSGPEGITAGPDGNVWFTEFYGDKIGRITPAGVVTEFAVPTPVGEPWGITTGPDRNLWFTEYFGDKIGRISPSGTITEFPIPPAGTSIGARGIVTGADGNLWFAEQAGRQFGRITLSGMISQFPASDASPFSMASGSNGKMLFAELDGPIGQLDISGKSKTIGARDGPWGITAGPDGNIWFTGYIGNAIVAVHLG